MNAPERAKLRAKMTDGTIEVFQSAYSAQDWRVSWAQIRIDLAAGVKVDSLTGAGNIWIGDQKFLGESGREFTLLEVEEILPD